LTNNTKYGIIVTNVTLGGEFLENYTKFLKNTFIFRRVLPDEARPIIENLKFKTQIFQKDEVVYSGKASEKLLGFVVSGGCAVYKYREAGGNLLMNLLKPQDSFGVLSVFSDISEYPTVILATKRTEILFIDAEECKALVSKSPSVALAVVNFLSDRVSFLNMKISLISGKTISEKLALYLLPEAYKSEKREVLFNINRIASILSVSRQTVYRGIEALQADGILSYENKKITITDLKGLERLTQ
jgi:CRP-like cAMP-binding protein